MNLKGTIIKINKGLIQKRSMGIEIQLHNEENVAVLEIPSTHGAGFKKGDVISLKLDKEKGV